MDAGIRRQPMWRLALWGAIATVLLIPLVAMRFTAEVTWTTTDFLFAGVLLGGAGALFELAMWRTRTLRTRALIGGAILLGVLVIWADAAVGIF